MDDDDWIANELRRLGLELPDVEDDSEGWNIPPRVDDTDWEWGE